jgi:hypothetical protein
MSDELDQQLRALGASLDLAPAPDLTAVVLSRLPDRRRPPRRIAGRAFAGALATALVLAAGALALPVTRHAILRVLGLRGVSIERVPRLAPPPEGAGRRLGLGKRIPLAHARRAANFTALLPAPPAAAYLDRDLPGGRISVLEGTVLITEFRGTALPLILKVIGPGTHLQRLGVNGGPGVYLSGALHQVIIQPSPGQVQPDRIRLAGNVLIWQQGPVTLRIEGTHTLRQALSLAHSLH